MVSLSLLKKRHKSDVSTAVADWIEDREAERRTWGIGGLVMRHYCELDSRRWFAWGADETGCVTAGRTGTELTCRWLEQP